MTCLIIFNDVHDIQVADLKEKGAKGREAKSNNFTVAEVFEPENNRRTPGI